MKGRVSMSNCTDNDIWQEHKDTIKQDLLWDLEVFFYNHQHDDIRFPHFKCCDRDYEYDIDGNRHYFHIFWEDQECKEGRYGVSKIIECDRQPVY